MANKKLTSELTNAVSYARPIVRTNGDPLDKTGFYDTEENAKSYAASADAYVGQLVSVISDDTVTGYQVKDTNGNLRKIAYRDEIDALDVATTSIEDGYFISQISESNGLVSVETTGNSISGNAATATKFNSQRTIKLTGSVTGEVSSDGASGWEIATTTNHNHDAVYVNVSGDSMPGQLKRDSDGGMWINGRDNALLRHTKSTSNSTFSPLISFKTKQGEISNGMIFGSSEDHLVWAYTTDADYNASPQVNEHVDLLKLSTDGKLTAKTFNAESDARLKENFQVPQFGTILDLPVYKFDYIRGPKNQIGCKAQDLQKICPEIVDENSDGYLSIQESKIVYLLLEEVKKLRKEIDELKGV